MSVMFVCEAINSYDSYSRSSVVAFSFIMLDHRIHLMAIECMKRPLNALLKFGEIYDVHRKFDGISNFYLT